MAIAPEVLEERIKGVESRFSEMIDSQKETTKNISELSKGLVKFISKIDTLIPIIQDDAKSHKDGMSDINLKVEAIEKAQTGITAKLQVIVMVVVLALSALNLFKKDSGVDVAKAAKSAIGVIK